MEAKKTLDARGLSCPMPVLKTKQAMDEIADGEVLEVLATDPGAKSDIAAWAKRTGNALLETTETDGVFGFYLRKGT